MKTKTLSPLLIGAAILTCSLGGVALAQQPSDMMRNVQDAGPPSRYDGQRGGPQRDPAERAARRAQRLRDVLQLSPNQEPALNAFVQSTVRPAGLRDQMRQNREAQAGMTTPERLDRMRARLAERQAMFTRRADATMRFYSQLTPTQKRAFDAMGAERKHRGGRGHEGMRHGGPKG